MTRQANSPNYSFLIETFAPEGQRLLMWRIDQSVGNVDDTRQVRRVTNSVERHLHYHYERTGLGYSCFAQGPKDEIDQIVAALDLELS